MAKKQDDLLSSNYDGIKEYDNDLPRWWVILFYLTILFAVVYSGYCFLGFRKPSTEILALQLQEIEKLKPVVVAGTETTEESLLALAKDPNRIHEGKEVFVGKCAACHGQNGEGVVGPNLTDDNWIHGNKLIQIKNTIEIGVLDKGMLAWKGILSEEEINDVVIYIHSLKGSNPPNPKAPEGEKYK